MQGTGSWILGGIVGLIGIFGLFLAANAVDGGIYYFGLLLFAFAVLFVFSLIRRGFDEREAAARGDEAAAE